MKTTDLVSIVIPVYNAEKYLKDTIDTIQNQTYDNWEAIFVDDCSNDNSVSIIKKEQKKDKRIKLIKNEVNSGAAISRNNGVNNANGMFICYLDADDKWDSKKIEKQVNFMKKKKCAFSFTGYEFCDEYCNPNGKKVYVHDTINYKQALKNTTIWTSTVMFNMQKLSKEDIQMPNVKSEDTALWWKILRTKVDIAYGLNEILSYYRRTSFSLSANKIEAIKRIWFLYKNVEKLSFISSIYNFCFYAVNAIKRRI